MVYCLDPKKAKHLAERNHNFSEKDSLVIRISIILCKFAYYESEPSKDLSCMLIRLHCILVEASNDGKGYIAYSWREVLRVV